METENVEIHELNIQISRQCILLLMTYYYICEKIFTSRLYIANMETDYNKLEVLINGIKRIGYFISVA